LDTNFHHGIPPDRAVPLRMRHECRVVLVVRVDHDNNVGTTAQRFQVARLLVAAVPAVLEVDDDFEAQSFRDINGLVVRDVVDQDNFVDHVHRQSAIGRLERSRGVVGGHDDYDPDAVLQAEPLPPPMIVVSLQSSVCSRLMTDDW
jgi:hypothetical protein